MSAITYLNSQMENAPQLYGATSTGLSILNTCLITGFNSKTLNTLTRVGNVVTATINAGHLYKIDDVVEISGATPTAYNGRWRVVSVPSSTTLTFNIDGTPTTPASGSMIIRYPSAGWNVIYSDTGKAVFQPSDPTATGHLLRVDDTAWKATYLTMSESMTNIDTGVNSKTAYFLKSNTNDTTTRRWWFVGDSKRFYFFNCWSNSSTYNNGDWGMPIGTFFGDINTWKAGDAYHCALIGRTNADVTNSMFGGGYPAYDQHFGQLDGTTTNKFISRGYHQLGVVQNFGIHCLQNGWSGWTGSPFPNPADNGIHIFPWYIYENSSYRGLMPGIYDTIETTSDRFPCGWRGLKNPENYPDREFIYMRLGVGTYSDIGGCFLDITGPW